MGIGGSDSCTDSLSPVSGSRRRVHGVLECVCMDGWMYVCMCICVYTYIYIHTYISYTYIHIAQTRNKAELDSFMEDTRSCNTLRILISTLKSTTRERACMREPCCPVCVFPSHVLATPNEAMA